MSDDRIALIYVGNYGYIASQAGGGLAPLEWTSDSYATLSSEVRGRATFGDYVVAPGRHTGRFYYGDNQGRLFLEDDADVVPFQGYSIIVPGYQNYGDPGGSRGEGKKITRLWSYLKSEDSAWRLQVWPGQEVAFIPDQTLNQPLGTTPAGFSNYAVTTYVDDVAASKLEQFPVIYNGSGGRRVRYQPKLVHSHITSGIPAAGHGHTFEYILTNPVGVEFIGLGGVVEPGNTSRGVLQVTAS
jgi:hypothetical protein